MNLAILIDAENVLAAHADQIFDHAASLGDIRYREIYGAGQALTTWVEPVLKYAIHANLTIKASKGKNSSDIALVIGAMDLLLAGGIDCVIIASSDSDFSALSVRLRNAGIQVIGMGTEKANPLWRTACSSFVVLQQSAQKAAKPQPARKAPARDSKPAPEKEKGKPAPEKPKDAPAQKPAVAPTHTERTAIIRDFIQKEIAAAGGRLQSNALFTALNGLPEYKVDQQRSRRRPLNYLTRQFGDAFLFEEGADGTSIVSMREAAPEAPAAPEAAAEPEAPEAPEQPAESAEAQDDPLARLLAAGLPEDDARQIVVIFTESDSLRQAYNKLRSTFGNTAGREYYQKVKEIASANGQDAE